MFQLSEVKSFLAIQGDACLMTNCFLVHVSKPHLFDSIVFIYLKNILEELIYHKRDLRTQNDFFHVQSIFSAAEDSDTPGSGRYFIH